MGCVTSSPNNKNTVISPNDFHHQQVEKKLLPLLDINHSTNINKKYLHISRMDPHNYTNTSIFRTHTYVCLVSAEELARKRAEFWETRLEGTELAWAALKFSIGSSSYDEKLERLSSAGLKLIGKSIQMSYDDAGFKYDLPAFVINQPSDFDVQKEVVEEVVKKQIKLTMVYLNFSKEVDIFLDKDIKIINGFAQEFVREKEDFEDGVDFVRLLYRGKILKDDRKLGNYVKDDDLIQIFKFRKNG